MTTVILWRMCAEAERRKSKVSPTMMIGACALWVDNDKSIVIFQ